LGPFRPCASFRRSIPHGAPGGRPAARAHVPHVSEEASIQPGNPDRLQQAYDPGRIEPAWYGRWEEAGVLQPKPGIGRPFVISIPPPNVTGSLTMGHLLGESVRDVVIRWQRMEGHETLYVPGMDHAGIATQNVVEKKLRDEGRDRREMGREAFLEEAWKWKDEYGGLILKQLRSFGITPDWNRARFTLDPGYSHAVLHVFKALYDKGLIYRGRYIVNWCPGCQTALSDEEVDHRETQGSLWHIKYPIKDSDRFIHVATTRPETMLGDTGVAVHPEDRRYAHLVGKTAILPLARREIPIVADTMVDPKFGTGAVKITPAHDPNDFETAQRCNLPEMIVMDEQGKMNENAGDFRGLDRFEARKRIVAALDDAGYVEKIDPHTRPVGHCSRCDTVIEPYLSWQWFVKMKPLAEPAIEAAKKGKIKFFPGRYKKVYLHWLENIRDWCISRQLWWGHRIPVWYRGEEMVVSLEAPEGEGWRQDEDVLDTWFSSWLWPFAIAGWPEETEDLARYYPNSLMVTAADIIFFWVARMVMAGIEFRGEVPFKHVFFTSLIRDAQGRKMSKSLGNSPDPLAMIEQYGADAVRFTMIYLTPTGQDLMFDEKRLETGKFFANKVWNASKLVTMRLGDEDVAAIRESSLTLSLADRWILSRFATATKDVTRYLKTYRLNEAAGALYQFIWHDYCDWYLEMAKPRWGDEADPDDRRTARWVAWKVLDGLLRLLHPFMPHVSEEIWQAIPHDGDLLALSRWPKAKKVWFDAKAEGEIEFLQELVVAVRNLRAEMNVPPGRKVSVVLRGEADVLDRVERLSAQFQALARIETITFARDRKRPQVAASAVTRGVEVFLPLEGLIDLDGERSRLSREYDKVVAELEGVRRKLRNQDFLNKARTDVVDREKQRLVDLEATLAKLDRARENLKSVAT
jgi:valyl-tRNA synthetase